MAAFSISPDCIAFWNSNTFIPPYPSKDMALLSPSITFPIRSNVSFVDICICSSAADHLSIPSVNLDFVVLSIAESKVPNSSFTEDKAFVKSSSVIAKFFLKTAISSITLLISFVGSLNLSFSLYISCADSS